ncbi:MAG: hypothetical protein KKG70_05345 [Proteobacteria bacterium]|nr:hypothetical protein [Pseudomonadota bacterium]
METLLGLHLEVDRLRITPCVPAHWSSYKIHYRFRDTCYHITVKFHPEKAEHLARVTMDGVVINGDVLDGSKTERAVSEIVSQSQGIIPLVDDRQVHHVEVVFTNPAV